MQRFVTCFSFVVQVSNTPTSTDRRKVSALKVGPGKSDPSKVERRVSIKSPAVRDGVPSRPVLSNKKPVSDAPQKAIGMSSVVTPCFLLFLFEAEIWRWGHDFCSAPRIERFGEGKYIKTCA